MIEAGVVLGLPRATATELVVQTLYGAATMIKETRQHPTVLREQVTSPGGTTAAALRQLDDHKVRAAFITAMEAAAERSHQLASGVRPWLSPARLDGPQVRRVDETNWRAYRDVAAGRPARHTCRLRQHVCRGGSLRRRALAGARARPGADLAAVRGALPVGIGDEHPVRGAGPGRDVPRRHVGRGARPGQRGRRGPHRDGRHGGPVSGAATGDPRRGGGEPAGPAPLRAAGVPAHRGRQCWSTTPRWRRSSWPAICELMVNSQQGYPSGGWRSMREWAA